MSRITTIAVSILAVMLTVGALGYFANDLWFLWPGADEGKTRSEQSQRPPPPVDIVSVRRDSIRVTTESIGTLRAREQVALTSQVTGLVRAIHFTEGQRVQQGQVLVELDDAQEQAELAEATAIQEEALRQYQRGRELRGSGLITPAKLDELEAAYKTATASVRVAEARLQNHQIKAPFSGLVGLRQISPGAWLTPGTVIAELNTLDPLDLAFGVRSEFLPQLQPGLTVLARTAGLDGQTFRGKLSRIDTGIDPQTRNVTVEAELANPDGLLKPGLFMTVDLVLQTRPAALVIPEEALLLRGEEKYVYLVQANNQVKRVAVETGQRQAGEVEISQGLQVGDRVVVGGLQKIREGQRVKPRQAAVQDSSSPDTNKTQG